MPHDRERAARGAVAGRGFRSLPGIDRARAQLRLEVPRPPRATGSGEILASGTVKDLVAGSGLRFTDRGHHELKGIEGDWALHAVTD